jgi:hypothetical protein
VTPRTFCTVAAVLFVATLTLRAAPTVDASRSAAMPRYADGAPPGFAGGFTDSACDACHFENPLNDKAGALTLTGLPEQFTPGELYTLNLSLTRPGLKLGGFQLVARLENGMQAGILAPGPEEAGRVTVKTQGGIQYASQRRSGAAPISADTARWTLSWQAPAAPTGPVQFHLAANAADNDDSVRGDYIYTATLKTSPR